MTIIRAESTTASANSMLNMQATMAARKRLIISTPDTTSLKKGRKDTGEILCVLICRYHRKLGTTETCLVRLRTYILMPYSSIVWKERYDYEFWILYLIQLSNNWREYSELVCLYHEPVSNFKFLTDCRKWSRFPYRLFCVYVTRLMRHLRTDFNDSVSLERGL